MPRPRRMKSGPKMSKEKCAVCRSRHISQKNTTGICAECQRTRWSSTARVDPRTLNQGRSLAEAKRMRRKNLAQLKRRRAA